MFATTLLQLSWLPPLLPLLAGAVIAVRMLIGRDRGDAAEPITAHLAAGSTLAALACVLVLDGAAILSDAPSQVRVGTWFASGDFEVPVSFTLDGLSLSIATLVTGLIWVTQRFAAHYLHREPGFHRFFFGLCLFASGMLLILLAGNAALAFVGWELAGFSSWMLIGYAYERPTATGNALRAFVTNRIGDGGFILSIALGATWLGSLEWPVLLTPDRDPVIAGLLASGLVLAALVKSAQVPFAAWIAGALEGPTPSSAVFYGSVMVHAGAFLLLRLEPLLAQTPALLAAIAAVGLLTALYGWLSGLVQTDIKSALMFATTAQVGLMFLAIGLGLFELAAWHLGLHALWRAYQFLSAPSYLQLVQGPAPPVPGWLARRQGLYTAALQRFWLDVLADRLLVHPTQSIARDVRAFDDGVVSRLVGLPEQARAAAILEQADAARTGAVIQGKGMAGALMAWLAERLYRFEVRLVLQPGGGSLARLLQQLGDLLLQVEAFLERPRYLLLLVMATFAVIL